MTSTNVTHLWRATRAQYPRVHEAVIRLVVCALMYAGVTVVIRESPPGPLPLRLTIRWDDPVPLVPTVPHIRAAVLARLLPTTYPLVPYSSVPVTIPTRC